MEFSEHDDDVDCARFEQLVKRGQKHVDAGRGTRLR